MGTTTIEERAKRIAVGALLHAHILHAHIPDTERIRCYPGCAACNLERHALEELRDALAAERERCAERVQCHVIGCKADECPGDVAGRILDEVAAAIRAGDFE